MQTLTDESQGAKSHKCQGVKTCEQNEDVYISCFAKISFFFSFSTALQKLLTCFPEDKLIKIYPDLQIQKVFTPWLLMQGFSFWSISERLNL